MSGVFNTGERDIFLNGRRFGTPNSGPVVDGDMIAAVKGHRDRR